MTEQEALAAIKAHSPQAQVTTNSLKFTYHDGAKQQETESFKSGLPRPSPIRRSATGAWPHLSDTHPEFLRMNAPMAST